MKYNPLAYIRSEKDILKLVNALIMNTKGEGEKSSEDFWVKAERLYYSALIGYIWYEATEEEKNFITLLDLINASEAREDDETYQSPVDLLFSQLEEREPDHFAVKQYRKFKMAAGKTLKSILISCGAINLIVPRRVLRNIRIRRRHVSLRLVVVVVGDKIFYCILREEFLKLTVQLCCKCFIVRYDQGWLI